MKNGKHAKREREEISTKRLAEAVRKAPAQAIRKGIALGLPVTSLEGDSIVKNFPNGRREVVKKLAANRLPFNPGVYKIK